MTIDRHLVLSLLLQEMGKTPDVLEKFEGRKYLQKIVYFAQMKSFGLDMGFGFSLHPHGPYSKELSENAKIMLLQKQECQEFAKKHSFSSEARKGLEQLKLFAGTTAGGHGGLDFLEAAATVHFLWSSPFKHLEATERKAKAIASCNELKPHFENKACQAIFAQLEKWNLLVT